MSNVTNLWAIETIGNAKCPAPVPTRHHGEPEYDEDSERVVETRYLLDT